MDKSVSPFADERLILQSGQGDITALRRLYDQAAGAVYCYALTIVRDDVAAREILRNTFISIWKNAGDYHVETDDALPWIMKICHQHAVDSGAHGKRFIGDNPYAGKSECVLMSHLLNSFPSKVRQVVILRAAMGLEITDIRDIIGGLVSGIGFRYTVGMFRLERDYAVVTFLGKMEEELALQAMEGIPDLSEEFPSECEMIEQGSNRSDKILMRSHLQPLRLAGTLVLALALVGTFFGIHLVNREQSEITVTTQNGTSMSVNAMDRVKTVVVDETEGDNPVETKTEGSTLTAVMHTVAREELDKENITADNNSVLITVQESDKNRAQQLEKETLSTVESLADEYGISPAVLVQVVSEDKNGKKGKEALAKELKQVLKDCDDQEIENLSVQDLTYLYFRRGVNLDSVELHGTPSEEPYQNGWAVANQIYENLNSDETWVDIFLTVWEDQLVYQVTVFQNEMKNIFEINASTGDIMSVRIVDEAGTEQQVEPEETPPVEKTTAEQKKGTGTGGTESSSSTGDYGSISSWIDKAQKVYNTTTSQEDPSVKVSNIIRDVSSGQVDLHLDLPGNW